MKFRVKTFCFLVSLSGFMTSPVLAQQQHKTAKMEDIFADLPFDDPVHNSILHENENALEKIKDNIFLRPALSRKRCYIGEPVLFTIQLYTRLQSTSTIIKEPYLSGFLSSGIGISGEPVKYRKENGKNYRVFTILRRQLIPLQGGSLKIDNLKIDNKVSYKDPAGHTSYYSGVLSTDILGIQVDSLPAKNKPLDFSGLTGNFSMTAFTGFNNIPAGESNILHIEITGTGNYIQAGLPVINWPDSISTFSIKEKVEIVKDSFPLRGRKFFEIPFIANKQGKIIIPSIQASYFDPVAGVYKKMMSEPVELDVLPPATAPTEAVQDKPLTGVTDKQTDSVYGYLIAGVVLLVVVAGSMVGWLYKKKKKRALVREALEDKQSIKRKMEEAFHNELAKLNAETDPVKFINDFKVLLIGYLQATTGTSISLEEELVKKVQGKDVTLAAGVQELFEDCNTFLYAPASLSEADRFLLTGQLTEIHKKVEALWS